MCIFFISVPSHIKGIMLYIFFYSVACGIFPDQGSNPCPLHWQADSQPLHHQGSPFSIVLMYISLIISESEHLSICSNAPYIFLCLLMIFSHFSNRFWSFVSQFLQVLSLSLIYTYTTDKDYIYICIFIYI